METLVESAAKLRSQGKLEEALLLIENYIKNNEKEYRAKILAAEYCENLSNFSNAKNYYLDAIEAKPSDAFNYLNFARFLLRRNEYDKSLKNFEKAYSLDKSSPIILTQLGRINLILGNTKKAEKFLEFSLKTKKNFPQTIYLLALTKLKLQKYKEGWKLYSRRQEFLNYKNISLGKVNPNIFEFKKKWIGQNLHNKKIVIIPEQGFGDFIMFSRYLKVLKDLFNPYIVLLCHPSFVELFEGYIYVDEVSDISKNIFEEKNTGFNFWATIFDLPVYLSNHNLENFSYPYIALKNSTKFNGFFNDSFKIGLCWKSSTTNLNSRNKSASSIKLFSRLFNKKNISLYSLQIHHNYEDKVLFPSNLIDLSKEINNFNDTANIISKLDAVITVDTAVAHLSGALNKTTYLLLPMYDSDWRWAENTEESAWYPSIKLLRLDQHNSWQDRIDWAIANLGIS